MSGSSHTLGKPHLGPTWHTHKKCGKIPLGLPTCGPHFDELTLGKLGKKLWQSVTMLVLEPNNTSDECMKYMMLFLFLDHTVENNTTANYFTTSTSETTFNTSSPVHPQR